jgi:hypothetical protein
MQAVNLRDNHERAIQYHVERMNSITNVDLPLVKKKECTFVQSCFISFAIKFQHSRGFPCCISVKKKKKERKKAHYNIEYINYNVQNEWQAAQWSLNTLQFRIQRAYNTASADFHR